MEEPSVVSPLPSEVHQAAQQTQLGKLVGRYGVNMPRLRTMLWVENALLGTCGAIFVVSIALPLFHVLPVFTWFFPVIWIHVLLWLVGSLKDSWVWRKGAQGGIYFYEQGLVTALFFQGEADLETISWEDVIAVWPVWGKGCVLSYEAASGEERLLHVRTSLTASDVLTREIQTQVAQVNVSRYLEDVERGEECAFGRLQGWRDDRVLVEPGFVVTRQGLRYQARFLPWNELASIELRGKKLVVRSKAHPTRPWVRVLARLIANVEALVELVSFMLEQQQMNEEPSATDQYQGFAGME